MKKYLYLIKINFINSLDYRQELLTNLLISVIIFVSMALFWRAIFYGRTSVKGFSYEEMIQYYIILTILSDIVDSKFAFTLSNDVRKGQITNLLLKPVNIKPWLFISEIGQLLPLLLIKLVIFLVFFETFIGKFQMDLTGFLSVLLVLPFAYLINANLYFILGCLAFWVGEIKGLLYGIRRIFLFLSGGFIPIVFFPELIQSLLRYLPFRYVFQLPVRILNEGFRDGDLIVLAGFLIWTVFLSLLARRFFSYSYKSNESVGI